MEATGWHELRRSISEAVRNDMEAPLREFYDEYFPAVYRYAYHRLGRDHGAAEEVAADVFYQAFRDIDRYDAEHAPWTWLKGIARHRTHDAMRKRGRATDKTVYFPAPDDSSGSPAFDLAETELPDAALEKQELKEAIGLALSELRPEQSSILQMKYAQDMSVNDIATRLSTTAKSAESRLFRARNDFREAFGRLAAGLNLGIEGAPNA
jgi:RNA polymerase sigma-70 factor (ECF subfamily)